MPLLASCKGLYFPATPCDNIIDLVWSDDSTYHDGSGGGGVASTPNTILVFKVKSTAPQLFHVRPHYGGMLLTGPSGSTRRGDATRTSVLFGLRSNYNDEGGGGPSGGTSAATRQYAGGGGGNGGKDGKSGGRHPERFVVDYAVIKAEPLAYQQMADALADPSRTADVVKSIWGLVSSNAISRDSIAVTGNVALKAYLDNVFVSAAEAQKASSSLSTSTLSPSRRPTIVPSNARLVPLSLTAGRRGSAQRSSAGRSTGSGGGGSPGNGGDNGSGGGAAATDELRALRGEIQALRHEVHSPNNSDSGAFGATSSPHRQHSNTSSQQQLQPGQLSAAASGIRNRATSGANANNRNGGLADPDDILMKLQLDPDVARIAADGTSERKKGMKLYLLLAAMFAVYVMCMLVRRMSGPSGKSGAAAAVTGNSTKAAAAVPPAAANATK